MNHLLMSIVEGGSLPKQLTGHISFSFENKTTTIQPRLSVVLLWRGVFES